MPALELNRVTRRYQVGTSTVNALLDVDLVVEPGDIAVVVGPSGSGKSTLLAVAGALLEPDEGTVTIAGTPTQGKDNGELAKLRRRHAGFVFQGANLVPYLTARENLEVAAGRGRAVTARASELLDRLGLANRARHLPAQLSGGERARVAIARALVNHPDVVLVDEPTAALDHHLSGQVMDLLVAEIKVSGAGAVIVTHDPLVVSYATRVFDMSDGQLEAKPVSDRAGASQ